MTDEQPTTAPPPEAADPSLSSAAKDAFFANEPLTSSSGPSEVSPPEPLKNRTYDTKARAATIEDADFDAEETNAKGGEEVE